MIDDVLVFTPVYRLEPETVQAVFNLRWDGPITWRFQRDNPLPGDDRTTGVLNHLHQYQRGRAAFLRGDYDAMLVIESDIIPPPDTLERLAALDADVAYGVYVFRAHEPDPRWEPVVNIFNVYPKPNGKRARNIGESFSVKGMWPPKEYGPVEVSGAGLGCTLIKRRVLEAIEFRALSPQMNPKVHCDSWFTVDAWNAGHSMMADTRVLCGHKTPEGEILWPPS